MTTKSRKATEIKIVYILNRYVNKSNGSVICHVRNGENKEYCVTINVDGSTGCYSKEGDECKGHKYAHRAGHECKHILYCQQVEAERRAREVEEIEALWSATETLAPYIREELDEETKLQQWTKEDQDELDAWAIAQGLPVDDLSREEYVVHFDPNGSEAA